ncbi:MAG TPA: hypothetical protein VGK94_03920 [Candidatus Polarisedimenticolia bacterium]|jgi:hypothetical protein
MFSAAKRSDTANFGARDRVLICKKAPADAADQEWTLDGRATRFDSVGTLAEALALCIREPVGKLIINMFSFTSSELTALSFFRGMRPDQHVILVCREEVAPMLLESGLADECHTVLIPEGPRNRAHRART